MVNSFFFFFYMEPEYSRSLSVFRDTNPIILNWAAPWDVSITPSAWIVGAWPEPHVLPLLVFGSGTQTPTLINGLCFQSTSTVLKIKYKSHWNPTSVLCTEHALQQLSFLTGFLSSPSPLFFLTWGCGCWFSVQMGQVLPLLGAMCDAVWERDKLLVHSTFSPNQCVSSMKISRKSLNPWDFNDDLFSWLICLWITKFLFCFGGKDKVYESTFKII